MKGKLEKAGSNVCSSMRKVGTRKQLRIVIKKDHKAYVKSSFCNKG